MGLLSSIFGKRPKVPPFEPVSIDEAQLDAIEGNIAATGPAASLAQYQQSADQEVLEQGIRKAFPKYDEYVSGTQNVIQQLMSGEVPEQVRQQVQNTRAAMGVARGGAGSQRLQFSTARDLGLTSLDLTMRGLQTGSQFFQQQRNLGMAQPMSVTSMFQTPAARLAHTTSERSMEFQRNLMHEKIQAAPNPIYQGLFKIGMQAAGAYFGGASGAVGSTAASGLAPEMNAWEAQQLGPGAGGGMGAGFGEGIA